MYREPFGRIEAEVCASPRRMVLFEGEDDRVLLAARAIEAGRLAHLSLIGDSNKIYSRRNPLDITLRKAEIVDPSF